MSADLALVLEIALVRHDDDGEVVLVLDACHIVQPSASSALARTKRERTHARSAGGRYQSPQTSCGR